MCGDRFGAISKGLERVSFTHGVMNLSLLERGIMRAIRIGWQRAGVETGSAVLNRSVEVWRLIMGT